MVARRPSEGDFTLLRDIHTDAGTMKTLAVDGLILSENESRNAFDRHLMHWDAHEFGIWLFSDLSSGESIGNVTSGGFGPSVGGPVAMGYVGAEYAQDGCPVQLSGRRGLEPAHIVPMPFVPHRYVRN